MALITSHFSYTLSLSTLDSGKVKLLRYVCDTNGRNGYSLYKEFKYPGLDSGFKLNVKYQPEKGFYVYGATYPQTYVIWHFDTTGALRWRQDFADTADGKSFSLGFQGDRMLLTFQTENQNMTGIHLLWMDSLGKVISEKAHGFPPDRYNARFAGSLLLPDSCLVMGFYNSGFYWRGFPWPVLIKFDRNFDTVWTRQLSYPRIPAKIDNDKDQEVIDRMLLTGDGKIAVMWHASYNDFYPYHGHAGFQLRKLDLQGNTLSEVSLDSVFRYGGKAIFSYNDMIATSDKGFAFVSGIVTLWQGRYSGWTILTKLSDTSIITGSLSSEEKRQGAFLLYPNPGRDAISLQLREGFQNADIRIYNALGREVQSHTGVSGNVFTIYREVAPKGIYFLKIKDKQNQTRTLKFIWE